MVQTLATTQYKRKLPRGTFFCCHVVQIVSVTWWKYSAQPLDLDVWGLGFRVSGLGYSAHPLYLDVWVLEQKLVAEKLRQDIPT